MDNVVMSLSVSFGQFHVQFYKENFKEVSHFDLEIIISVVDWVAITPGSGNIIVLTNSNTSGNFESMVKKKRNLGEIVHTCSNTFS